MSATDLIEYTSKSDVLLNSVFLSHDLILCDDVKCTNVFHHKAIDVMYIAITESIIEAGEDIMHEGKTHANQVLGWNDVCKEVHADARESFRTWTANNKPTHGPIFDIMKRSRACFKYVLRQCTSNDNKTKANNLAMKLMNKES